MKIIYCIACTCNSGGMERVLANKANYLTQHGYEIIIVTTDQRGRLPFFQLAQGIRNIDLDINYDENNGKSFLNKLLHYPIKQALHKKRLKKVLMEERPDITVSMFNNDACFIPHIKDGSAKVLEIHFSRFKRLQYGRKGIWKLADVWRSFHDKYIVKKYDRFVVLTKEDKGYWGNLDNISIIPNACTFSFERQALLQNKEVLAVGRYSYQKGFDLLIEAWRIVCNKTDDWILRIVGDGELRDRLQQQINDMGLGKHVILDFPRTDMPFVYSQSSIFVLSSRYEGLPMVLLEAQAAGIPVVSFTCKCGPRDIIDDGVNGFLVDENDIQGLSDKILQLIENVQLRKKIGLSAYYNSKRYSMEIVMSKWIDLFNNLIE